MKVNLTYIYSKLSKRALILLLPLLFISLGVFSQGLNDINTVLLIGQITNSQNGGPIKNHEVIVSSDSTYNPQFVYFKKLLTDFEGYYYDTISTFDLKGGLNISTSDYLSNQHDTSVFFRFTWSEENVLFANFELPIQPQTVNYQANFYYQRNPSGNNNLEYSFFDLSNSDDIISWEWNFGDGNFSSQTVPKHTYSESGVYRVKLTVVIQPTPYSIPYTTSIVKIINVASKNYFHMGGHVMAGYFPIDKGEAYLYKLENKEITLIDTAIFSEPNGHYCFYQLIEGEYIVKSDLHPTSTLYNQYMTTYYSNEPTWTEADTIFHNATSWEYHINLIPVTQVMTGPGLIAGTINYTYNPTFDDGFPACNVEILLYNENDEPVTCTHSDEDGNFAISDLEMGTFKVHAEVTGKYTYPLVVTLNESGSSVEGIILTISNYAVNGSVSAIDDYSLESSIGQIYPNPAVNNIHFEFNLSETDELDFTLFNEAGQMIQKFSRTVFSGKNIVTFDVSSLTRGIYFIGISNSNIQTITRKLLKQ